MKVLIGVQISGKNNVKRIVADGAYDSNGNFRFLCQNDIEPAIMVRKNLSLSRVGGRSRTHSPSKGVVVLNNSELRDGNTIYYGYRYGRNSILFYQKVFGECVSAKFPNIVKELLVNVSLHDILSL